MIYINYSLIPPWTSHQQGFRSDWSGLVVGGKRTVKFGWWAPPTTPTLQKAILRYSSNPGARWHWLNPNNSNHSERGISGTRLGGAPKNFENRCIPYRPSYNHPCFLESVRPKITVAPLLLNLANDPQFQRFAWIPWNLKQPIADPAQ